jgi:two-component system, OmpR family, phosphate regulon sensor histidine kinase PhoR
MTKRKVTLLITLMAVAIVGIMALQLVWMRNALQVRNELFDRSVNEALNRTSDRLETLSDVFMVHDIVAPPPPPPPVPFNPDRKGKGFSHVNRTNHIAYSSDSLHRFEYSSDNWNGKIKNRIKIVSGDKPDSITKKLNIEIEEADSLLTNWEDKIEHKITVMYGNSTEQFNCDSIEINVQPDLKNKIGKKVQRLKNVAGQMIYETWDWNGKYTPDTASLRSVLTDELMSMDIPIGYEFAVVGADGIHVKTSNADSDKLLNSEYTTRLYPNNIFDNNEDLKVYFPGRRAFMLKTLLIPASLSLLFCSIIMIAFGLSIYYILKQKKVSEMKSDFINNMTHEFKTPLATISVAADTIINPKIISDPERIIHFMGIIKKENQRMNQQVETILQIARVDKKDFEFQFKTVDIHEIIERAVQGMALQIESRNGNVTIEKGAANPMVTTDPVHTLSMMNNLLDNANKYSESDPEIEIKTRNSERGVWISVSDNGIGMSKQVQHKIFEKFYREATGNVHNVKGFGLGLSYVKAVVDANRGEVRVTSELGKGSTFEVFLPFMWENNK